MFLFQLNHLFLYKYFFGIVLITSLVNISGKEELEYIDYIVDYLGSPKGIAFICTGSSKDKEAFEAYLEKYHIPN